MGEDVYRPIDCYDLRRIRSCVFVINRMIITIIVVATMIVMLQSLNPKP